MFRLMHELMLYLTIICAHVQLASLELDCQNGIGNNHALT